MKKNVKKSVKDLISSLEKKFGEGAVMSLSDENSRTNIETIPSGSIALNKALGVGGYPRGRIVEVYGPESSGKTTLCLHAIAQTQLGGGIAAFIDAEHAFDPTYAKAIGVNLDDLVLSQPDSGEQGLEIAEALARSGDVGLVVIDSVAALTPKAEIEGNMGDSHMGLQARLMSQALRKLTAVCHRTNTTLVFINQLRQKIGVVFGNPETTTGGNALKFYASVRLDVRRIGQVKAGDQVIGSRTRVKVVKNKMAPPFQLAEFDIRWGTGIDAATDLLERAVEAGVVDQRGSHFSFGDERLGQGRERARAHLLATDKLSRTIRRALTAANNAGLVLPDPPAGVPEQIAEAHKIQSPTKKGKPNGKAA